MIFNVCYYLCHMNEMVYPFFIGVNTSDILTAYISAIKALRVLDRSGVVLQVVSEPVCKYLRWVSIHFIKIMNVNY